MSMVLIGHRLSSDDLQAVLGEPTAVSALIYGDLDDDDADMPEPELDLDKSWHAIHYLLTGTAWEVGDDPAGAAILGGVEVGEDDGYGPARLLHPEAVRAVSTALDALTIETLRARFKADAMAAAEIYPEGWTGDAGAFDDYLAPHFAGLRDFYRTAAANGQAVLLAIT